MTKFNSWKNGASLNFESASYLLEKKGFVPHQVKAEAQEKLHEAPCQSLAGHDDIFRVKEAKRKDLA